MTKGPVVFGKNVGVCVDVVADAVVDCGVAGVDQFDGAPDQGEGYPYDLVDLAYTLGVSQLP